VGPPSPPCKPPDAPATHGSRATCRAHGRGTCSDSPRSLHPQPCTKWRCRARGGVD